MDGDEIETQSLSINTDQFLKNQKRCLLYVENIPLRNPGRKIEYTCIDASKNFMACGANTGSVYLYQRSCSLSDRETISSIEKSDCECRFGNFHLLKMIPSPRNDRISITFVSICPNEKYVAIGNTRGLVYAISISSFTELKSKPVLRLTNWNNSINNDTKSFVAFSHELHMGLPISYLLWDVLGLRLFSCCFSGYVCMTSFRVGMAAYFSNVNSEVLIKEETGIVQLDYFENVSSSSLSSSSLSSSSSSSLVEEMLLVSSQTRVLLLRLNTEQQTAIQIGNKLRQGSYGACFFPSSSIQQYEQKENKDKHLEEQKETIDNDKIKKKIHILCSRPGKRVWLADPCDGKVASTLKFQFPVHPSSFQTNPNHYPKMNINSMDREQRSMNLGLLERLTSHRFKEEKEILISYTKNGNVLILMDVEKIEIIEYHIDLGIIYDLKRVEKNLLLVLHGDKQSQEQRHLSFIKSCDLNEFIDYSKDFLSTQSNQRFDLIVNYGIDDLNVLNEFNNFELKEEMSMKPKSKWMELIHFIQLQKENEKIKSIQEEKDQISSSLLLPLSIESHPSSSSSSSCSFMIKRKKKKDHSVMVVEIDGLKEDDVILEENLIIHQKENDDDDHHHLKENERSWISKDKMIKKIMNEHDDDDDDSMYKPFSFPSSSFSSFLPSRSSFLNFTKQEKIIYLMDHENEMNKNKSLIYNNNEIYEQQLFYDSILKTTMSSQHDPNEIEIILDKISTHMDSMHQKYNLLIPMQEEEKYNYSSSSINNNNNNNNNKKKKKNDSILILKTIKENEEKKNNELKKRIMETKEKNKNDISNDKLEIIEINQHRMNPKIILTPNNVKESTTNYEFDFCFQSFGRISNQEEIEEDEKKNKSFHYYYEEEEDEKKSKEEEKEEEEKNKKMMMMMKKKKNSNNRKKYHYHELIDINELEMELKSAARAAKNLNKNNLWPSSRLTYVAHTLIEIGMSQGNLSQVYLLLQQYLSCFHPTPSSISSSSSSSISSSLTSLSEDDNPLKPISSSSFPSSSFPSSSSSSYSSSKEKEDGWSVGKALLDGNGLPLNRKDWNVVKQLTTLYFILSSIPSMITIIFNHSFSSSSTFVKKKKENNKNYCYQLPSPSCMGLLKHIFFSSEEEINSSSSSFVCGINKEEDGYNLLYNVKPWNHESSFNFVNKYISYLYMDIIAQVFSIQQNKIGLDFVLDQVLLNPQVMHRCEKIVNTIAEGKIHESMELILLSTTFSSSCLCLVLHLLDLLLKKFPQETIDLCSQNYPMITRYNVKRCLFGNVNSSYDWKDLYFHSSSQISSLMYYHSYLHQLLKQKQSNKKNISLVMEWIHLGCVLYFHSRDAEKIHSEIQIQKSHTIHKKEEEWIQDWILHHQQYQYDEKKCFELFYEYQFYHGLMILKFKDEKNNNKNNEYETIWKEILEKNDSQYNHHDIELLIHYLYHYTSKKDSNIGKLAIQKCLQEISIKDNQDLTHLNHVLIHCCGITDGMEIIQSIPFLSHSISHSFCMYLLSQQTIQQEQEKIILHLLQSLDVHLWSSSSSHHLSPQLQAFRGLENNQFYTQQMLCMKQQDHEEDEKEQKDNQRDNFLTKKEEEENEKKKMISHCQEFYDEYNQKNTFGRRFSLHDTYCPSCQLPLLLSYTTDDKENILSIVMLSCGHFIHSCCHVQEYCSNCFQND